MSPLKSYILVAFSCLFITHTQAQYANNSVLSSGSWYKMAVSETGIHKISYNTLQNLGIDPSSFDFRTLKIYGNGGGMLPQANNIARLDDLQENALWAVGQEDGRFDTGDYILFYAKDAHQWNANLTKKTFEHAKNLYDDKNYYFLTFGGNNGLRIQNQASETGATLNISVFDEYFFYEADLVNILHKQGGGSGREWYGDDLSFETQKTFALNVEGIVSGSNLQLTSAVLAQAFSPTRFTIQVNGTANLEQSVEAILDATYTNKGTDKVNDYLLNTSNLGSLPALNLTYNFVKNQASDRGYLNYIRLNYQKNLALYGNQTIFRSLASLEATTSNFNVQNVSNDAVIWDVSNPILPKNQAFQLSGSQATFGAITSSLTEFVVWRGNDFPQPEIIGAIPNQNLHALNPPNLLIVTPESLLSEAQRLAELRRTHDQLTVQVVTLREIYNEFSSGRQDISAIRDFARMFYVRNGNTFKYLLLFGDASFDYKNRVDNNTNLVPIYESRESLHPIYSYSSDDYFGFLENDEGIWEETTSSSPVFDHTLDIGVGRLPVKNITEARQVVDKLIHYATSPLALGNWRKKITFVADDGDFNQHQRDANDISNDVDAIYGDFNVKKIFLDAYPQETTPSGQVSPIAKNLLDNTVEQGTLILNYTGHGGEVGWAEESILRTNQVQQWTNYNKLPLMITATCEFGRYDEPKVVSGAEVALLSNKGGAIGLITTTRPVFSSTNFLLNKRIYETILEENNGQMPRLGDIMIYTKNNSLSGSINRNFSLLGDPSMRLAYPKEEIAVTEINGKDIAIEQDSIKALEKIEIKGEIRNQVGERIESFNGILDVIVFDKPTQRNTIGTENSARMAFSVRETLLFQGKATVKNGVFVFSFVPPKNINYTFGNGKISLYASSTELNLDAGSGKTDIIIGGSTNNLLNDTTPPEVSLFLNDSTFRNGGLVNENPLLIARLFDENGINISDYGIGHSITTFLNDSTDQVKVLNEYYIADLDTYQSGEVLFPFKNLPNGKHSLTFKAFDVYNNPTEKTIEFIVADSAGLVLREVLNYPNPLFDYTNFQIEHNRLGDNLEVRIDIYTQQGQLVNTLQTTFNNSPTRIDEIRWEGVNNNNAKLGNGLYIYRVTVKSLSDNSQASVTNRLVIIK